METEQNEEIESTDSEVSENPISENPEIDGGQSGDTDMDILNGQVSELLTQFEDSQNAVTAFDTPSGPIDVVHVVTLGDLLVSTLLASILIFLVLNQLIRRF